MIRVSFTRFGLLLIPSIGLVLSACVSNPSSSFGLKAESRSVAGVEVQSVNFRTNAHGVMIYGVVRRGFGYSGALHSHLDVEVVGPEGNLRQEIAIDYIPRPIPRSHRTRKHSDYAVQLAELPPPGSIIRVSHHPVSRSKCPLGEGGTEL
jgi:hypothetical protein